MPPPPPPPPWAAQLVGGQPTASASPSSSSLPRRRSPRFSEQSTRVYEMLREMLRDGSEMLQGAPRCSTHMSSGSSCPPFHRRRRPQRPTPCPSKRRCGGHPRREGSFSAAAAASGPKTSSAVRSTATTGRSMPHRRAPGRSRATLVGLVKRRVAIARARIGAGPAGAEGARLLSALARHTWYASWR